MILATYNSVAHPLVLVRGLVLLVGDGFEPAGAVAGAVAFEHGEVAHQVAGGGAVPVFFAGSGPDGVAGRIWMMVPSRVATRPMPSCSAGSGQGRGIASWCVRRG